MLSWAYWHPAELELAEVELAEVELVELAEPALAGSYPLIHCLVVLHWLDPFIAYFRW